MPPSIADQAKKWYNDTKKAISEGSKQTDSLGPELAERAKMNASALPPTGTPPPAKGTTATPVNMGGNEPYGSRPGEKRIDTSDMTKPLGSFAKGTDSVPQTGVYKVHKGEKVVPAKTSGAPVDFGGRVFPNPTGIKPAWDTDKPKPPKSEPHGAKGDVVTPEEMRNPIGSFAKGTDSVPTTGVYKVHEGEKVVAAKDNMEHSPEEKAHFHRAMSHLHAGALHRHLGIPEGQPIPEEKKKEAAASDNPHVAAMGRLAVAMSGWKHGKK